MTLTPEAAHSMARLFVKLSTAALAAPVWLSWRGHVTFHQTGTDCKLSIHVWCWLMVILTPSLGSLSTCQQWCSRSHPRAVSSTKSRLRVDKPANNHTAFCAFTNTEPVLPVCILPAWQQWKVPVRLVSITAFQPLEVMCSAGLLNWPPPLFTRKSILPHWFSTDDTRAFTCHTGNQNKINTVNTSENVATKCRRFEGWQCV